MTIPKKFGGPERPLLDAVLAVETVAKYCGVTARLIVETNMGALGCVMAYGTEEQCQTVAHRILVECDKPAIGMTEPEAGTALTDLQTRADKQGRLLGHQRQEALDYRRRHFQDKPGFRSLLRQRPGTWHRRHSG